MAEKRHSPTLAEILMLCRKFLFSIKFMQSYSTQTVRSYASDLAQAFALSREKMEAQPEAGADSIGPNQATAVRLDSEWLLEACRAAQMRWKGLSPASRNRKASCLKSFLGWLLDEEIIDRDLALLIHSPKVPIRLPHHLSVDEALALLSATREDLGKIKRLPRKSEPADREAAEKSRDLALLLLLYGGGLRVSEACGLEWARVNFRQGSIRVLGKGGKERIVVLPPVSFKALEGLARTGPFVFGEGPLSTRLAYEIVKKRGERAGLLQPLHPHALRHSFATHLLTSGANLRTLQELLGHSTLQATQRYTHIGVDQLARTMEAFHPFGNEQKGSRPHRPEDANEKVHPQRPRKGKEKLR